MDSGVYIALIVAFAGVVGPSVLALIAARAHRSEREQDYDRQDELAAAVAAREAAAAAAAAEVVNGKLDQIHELTNSTLFAAKAGEHTALKAQRLALGRMLQLQNGDAGRGELVELDELDKRIAELGAELDERAKQTRIADAQLAA